jgi:gliding motility-associated-like protein
MNGPGNGAINVNVGTNISWDYAPTATEYVLSVGTTAGAADVIPVTPVGNVLSFNPTVDLPPNTTLFVTVVPENIQGSALGCVAQTFTTGDVATLPDCTALTIPADGATDVDLNPTLEWAAVPDAVGYRVTIGFSPSTGEILNETNFTENFTDFIEFEPNRTFFVRITPYNDAGLAIDCPQTTFSTQLGCGPFFDTTSGELVTLNPEISFPETVYYCGEGPQTITSTDPADGVRWYQLDDMGNETFLANGFSVDIEETGMYRYEAFNVVSQPGGDLECNSTQLFEVLPSETATITNIDVTGSSGIVRIEVTATGLGDYEYALDAIDGPYQDSPVFDNIPTGNHMIHVRDKNGCGIVSQDIDQEIALDGFPRFFTPNGDGVNDMWQYSQPANLQDIPLNNIEIYDRYGRLIASISPNSTGWDGTFKGKPLPSADYWFRANVEDREEIKGHFSLKR